MKNLNVIIAGAGLGGLTAAACLMKRGFKVHIYEQAAALGEVGAGVQSSANAVNVLYDLGLRDELEQVAVRPKAFEFRRFDTAELLHRIPLGENHEQAFGAPYYHIHRADLHDILARKVLAMDPNCITLNARVESFEENADGVTLNLADGRKAHGDVLIGADGIKSAIRAQILGPTPATYTGDIAWRATIPTERLPAGIMDVVSTVWCGPKKHATIYYLRAGKLVNFVGLVEYPNQTEVESWTQKRPWEELKADYAGWHPTIQTIIDAIDKDSCYRWALNNREPVSNWSTSRATLMGDAAHPTLPYMASGAAMAIEDGAVLSRALEMSDSVPDALQLYQRNRLDRTARIVRGSTDSRALYRIEDEEEMRRAFKEQNLTKSRSEWLYSYNPITVPLV
ncbi:salicylate hydroxylase [Noviherbaspirillum humi]|uniref:Salicylate hydroxylase n=1 Tax=Noviherbaspirillum humi TaxID=1688639 RepID=A0A239K3H5_9BURK|nr:FAD-dependent monooxygenase [Noviherbaspirillum humi]SNT12936.1 salicylate hydroxylase [Noviherbaspirillum humi]